MGEDVASDNVQNIVQEIIANAHGNTEAAALAGTDDSYCKMIIDVYSNDYLKTVTDTKYGSGSCDYIAEAFRYSALLLNVPSYWNPTFSRTLQDAALYANGSA